VFIRESRLLSLKCSSSSGRRWHSWMRKLCKRLLEEDAWEKLVLAVYTPSLFNGMHCSRDEASNSL